MRLFVTFHILLLLLSALTVMKIQNDHVPFTNTLLIEELAGVMS
ncbi:MAG: hypothetical protein AB7V50_08900 [Vampirovibrionia bacterium]